MVRINSHTSKQDLLSRLTSESKLEGDLYIEIESLPNFLGSYVSFAIFNYQTSNYPRKIIWVSQNKQIVEFLRNCSSLATTYKSQKLITGDDKNIINKPAISSVSDNRAILEYDNLKDLNSTKNTINFDNSDKILNGSLVPTKKYNDFSFPNLAADQGQTKNHRANQLSAENLFNSHYQPTSLIDNSGYSTKSNQEGIQDLDNWLERIESTKQALSSIKEKISSKNNSLKYQAANPFNKISQFIKPVIKQDGLVSNKEKRSISVLRSGTMILQTFSFVFIFAALFIFLLGAFPTRAYTLDINPIKSEDAITVDLLQSDFLKQSVELSALSEIPASGQKEINTERAVGKIKLINKSSTPIYINKLGLKIIKNDLVYYQINDKKLPSVLEILPDSSNQNEGLEIEIQASNAGSKYNLAVNTKVEITNLKGQKLGINCYGIVTSEIVNKEISGEKIVTEADYNLLKNNVETFLNENRFSEIKKISDSKNNKYFTSTDWYKNIQRSDIYTKNIGDVSDKVSLKSNVNSEIYYLAEDKLEKILKIKNREINELTDIIIVDSKGGFLNSENTIQLKIFYKYNKFSNLDKNQVIDLLENNNVSEAKSVLQEKYPDINNVEIEEKGLKIPLPKGLKANINIKCKTDTGTGDCNYLTQ